MTSNKIKLGQLNFVSIPDRLDSTRIVLRRFDPTIRYCCMISNYGSAWNWVKGRLYMQKPVIAHNLGLFQKGRSGRSYIMFRSSFKMYKNALGSERSYLHRCVAQVWVRVPRKLARLNIKLQVDHINGNRYDNRPQNLRWCTPSQNMYYSHRARKGLPV